MNLYLIKVIESWCHPLEFHQPEPSNTSQRQTLKRTSKLGSVDTISKKKLSELTQLFTIITNNHKSNFIILTTLLKHCCLLLNYHRKVLLVVWRNKLLLVVFSFSINGKCYKCKTIFHKITIPLNLCLFIYYEVLKLPV
jgi:hypothetical protein